MKLVIRKKSFEQLLQNHHLPGTMARFGNWYLPWK